jgi:hypothetical protein
MTKKEEEKYNKYLDDNFHSKCCKDTVRGVGKVISFYQCQKCFQKCAIEDKYEKIIS